MVFTILDTPRTEIGDQTRMSGFNDPDLSTQHSIPSPSKEDNDLLNQIKGMRPAAAQTPRTRAPLGDRRNLPSKAEFTPLLKSAAKKNFFRASGNSKGNVRLFQTPAGVRLDLAAESPALPFSSSVMIEEDTGYNQYQPEGPSLAPPVESSSPASTPMVPPRRDEGPLDARGNLATLREQEARLEQIDKENFSLKLKIHFLEEALRKSGKDFNEAALRENTELKVDKVTLQRDLKHYRKSLAQAEKDLEEYRQQLKDYVEKVKRRHASEGMHEELDAARKDLADREDEIQRLRQKLTSIEDAEGQIADLEAELREKDRELDIKDDELEALRDLESNGDRERLEQLEGEQQSRIAEYCEKEDAFRNELKEKESALNEQLKENQRLSEEVRKSEDQKTVLRQQEREIENLRDQLAADAGDKSVIRNRGEEVERMQVQIYQLKQLLDQEQDGAASQARKLQRLIEDKDAELETFRQKLEAVDGRNESAEELQDKVPDLEAEIRRMQGTIDDRDDALEKLQETLEVERRQTDEELQECDDRIQQLEGESKQHLQDLQALRDGDSKASTSRSQALEDAEAHIKELESRRDADKDVLRDLREDINKLHDKTQQLERELKAQDANAAVAQERWSSERRTLESSKTSAEDQAAGLQRTVDRLQEVEGTLSGKELRLQEALQSEKQRYDTEKDRLAEELREARAETEQQLTALHNVQIKLRDAEFELGEARVSNEQRLGAADGTQADLRDAMEQSRRSQQQLEAHKGEQTSLQEKIQGLEDEIEVLQLTAEEDADRQRDDLDAAKQEIEGLRRQLRCLQQDLAQAQNERDNFKTRAKTSSGLLHSPTTPRGSPRQQQEAERKVEDLSHQLSAMRQERDSLQKRLAGAERAQANAQADRDTLQIDVDASSGTKSELQQRLKDVQSQLWKVKTERAGLESELFTVNSDLDLLQSSTADLRLERETLQQQMRDLRIQLSSVQREHERKSQGQVLQYEQDIQNLEQDLADASSKHTHLETQNKSAQQQISRLKTKVESLESQLSTLRTQRGSSDTSVAERRDLHEMLKDAKLEAEDLALQVKERDSRVNSAASKEGELRGQLKRLREQRAAQTSRADSAARDLQMLQRKHDILTDEMAELNARQPRSGRSARNTPSTDDVAVTQRRHAAELRGLVKQIEYLGARCKRQERFRTDLTYIKTYFTKQVEMHGQCTKADLQLVKAMGIPTDEVLREQEWELVDKVGRTRTRSGDRPSLKCVGLMVVAACRMRRAAEGWGKVRGEHEGLLRKLRDVQQGRRKVGVK